MWMGAFVWPEVKRRTKVGWSCATTDSGALCVTISGADLKLPWSVLNSATAQMVSVAQHVAKLTLAS